MDKKKIKRIIAREGLILLLFLLASFFIYQRSGIISDLYVKIRYSHITPSEITLLSALYAYAYSKVEIFSYLLYPFYWLIRFIIWAIKTLRKKGGDR